MLSGAGGGGGTVRVPRRLFLLRYVGNAMLAVGGSLFGAAAAYEIYANRAEAGLSHLNRGSYTVPGAPQAVRSQSEAQPPVQAATGAATAPAEEATPAATQAAAESATAEAAVPVPSAAPGEEPATFAASAPAVQRPDVTPGMLPVKLRIPSIGLNDARVVEVGTKLDNGQLVWATADHAVGHNIGTAVPGQEGNMVLAGHISSPVRGEGNIFHSLPNLADKLGSRVSVQNADGNWFVYEIIGTRVVTPADTWVLNDAPTPIVTLLTCVPDGVYTHRFVALGRYLGTGGPG